MRNQTFPSLPQTLIKSHTCMHIVHTGSHNQALAVSQPPDNPGGAVKLFGRDQQTVSGEPNWNIL